MTQAKNDRRKDEILEEVARLGEILSLLEAHLGRGLAEALLPRFAKSTLSWVATETYTRQQTMDYWNVGEPKLSQWQKDGLPVLNAGNKEYRYYGQDVIDFVRGKVAPGSHKLKGAAKKAAKPK